MARENRDKSSPGLPHCPETRIVQQGLLFVSLSGVESLPDLCQIHRSVRNDKSRKAGRGNKQNALGQRPCGEGVSGSAGVAFRCVILRGRRRRWRLVSYGEGVFCGTFKAGK